MTTKQLIQAGIDGGWNKAVTKHYNIVEVDDTMIFLRGGGPHIQYDLNTLILDPEFWQAVGKSLGWGTEMWHEDDGKKYWDYYVHCPACGEVIVDAENGCVSECNMDDNAYIISWHYNMLRMIDALAEGKSISEFIKTL